jgi:A1 cistron-splicing factor AAR2
MDSLDRATILLLNLPPGALCGINLLSFTTSPRFHGVKLLPKGVHFIYSGATTSLSVRHGVWIDPETPSVGQGEIIIKVWDADKEELVDEKDESEKLRWKSNIGGLWHENLTPYRQSIDGAAGEINSTWTALVDCVTPSLLNRITGGQRNDWALSTSSAMRQDMEDIPGLTYGENSTIRQEKELNFLPIDLKRTWRDGAIGRERTEAAKDRSWALGDIVAKYCSRGDEREVVGEMQFCFLMVLTLGNFSCLSQWKRLLNLVLTCQTAVRERPDLFVRILRGLRLQLQRCSDVEGGLFDLTDEGGTVVAQLLKRFRRGLEDEYAEQTSDVRDEYAALEAYVQREFGWELSDSFVRRGVLELEDGEQVEMELSELEGEDERGEYAPVIVYLGEDDLATTPTPPP